MLKHKLLCNLLLVALLLPTGGIIVLAAKPPAPVPATSKGPLQDMMDSGLTRKQAIAYLSLIRDSRGRKIKNFSKYKGKEYRFAKGKPNYKVGKARLNAWLKWYRSHKKHATTSAKPANQKVAPNTPSVVEVKPTPSPAPAITTAETTPTTKNVEKKVSKIDLPVTSLTLPINDPYDAPPAKVIYTDGTFEWLPQGNVKSSNESILSIGKNGHSLNLNKQGEVDLLYWFGKDSNTAYTKMHVTVGPENHRVRNMLFLSVILLVVIGSLIVFLSWRAKRQFSKHVIIENADNTPDPASAPPAQATGAAAGTGPTPTP